MRARQWVLGSLLVIGLPGIVALSAWTPAPRGQVGGQAIGLPQAPPRDAPPPRSGTGVIAGTVVAADTGLPIRRAVVSLMTPLTPASRRTILVDGSGAFTFDGLAAGTYSLRAEPGAHSGLYVSAAYGTSATEAVGRNIVLKDGERVADAHITLPRAGAIEGRVVDEFGDPVARVPVYTVRVMGGGTSFMRGSGGMPTDDLGRFRIYGLTRGEYLVAAEARSMGGMGMAITEGDTEGFMTTFYPSALVEREGMRVRIAPGTEVTGLQIQLVRTRSFRISGTVVDSRGQPVSRPNLVLVRPTAGGSTSVGAAQFEATGRFTFRDVVPGEYRLVVRQGMTGPPPPPGVAPVPPAARPEYATVPLHVAADIEDLLVVTAPGVSIAGTLVFAEGAPPKLPPGLRVTAQQTDRLMMTGPPSDAAVSEDLRFTLNELFAPVRVRLGSVPPGHALQAVLVAGKDITDEPFEFRASHSGQLHVVLTSRVGHLEGQVTGDDGQPPRTGIVLLLPDDKSLWKIGSARMRTLVVREGRFTASAVLPGRYFVVAVPQEDYAPGPDPAPEFFEALAKEATAVVIAEGETRSVELRLLRRQ